MAWEFESLHAHHFRQIIFDLSFIILFLVFISYIFESEFNVNFSNPDEILNILLSLDLNYDEILETAQNLVQDIVSPHTNEAGIKYPSALSQCILECFKLKNNFASSKWFSSTRIDNALIKPNQLPVSFSRQIANGEIVNYQLFNLDQIYFEKFNISIPISTQNKELIIHNTSSDIKQNSDNVKLELSILRFVKDFNGLYGRGGISKILKGSSTIKDNDFNNQAKNSLYFGLLNNFTQKKIIEQIDFFIEKGVLYLSNSNNYFLRPIVKIREDYDFEKIYNDLPVENIEDDEQDEIFKKIIKFVNNGDNVFITGHAGTGKSFLLNKLKQKYKELVLTSTTGIAAVNVKGQTLHSFAGVGICNKPISSTIDNILKKTNLRRQITKCSKLAVDEISMLDIKTFEYIDEVLRQIRACNKPFGGIQVIFIGDFYQLPPVVNINNDVNLPKYCFESELWKDFDFKTIILTKNYRQNEESLIKALGNMRVNSLTQSDIELFRSRECADDVDLSDILHIFATNSEADRYNNMKFQSIESKVYQLNATDGIYKNGEICLNPENEREENMFRRINTVCNADKVIYLKNGVRVMLLTNLDFDKGLINGSCGVVEAIEDDCVKVRFDNGISERIEQHDFEFYNNETPVAVRKQYPLRLAYAITIHKSQGMSLDKLVVDCARIFEKGQVYVALSRIKTLNGLYLRNFNPLKVMVDEKVCEFYKTLN